jgi:transcriptional regulator with XRE-family HTH domain
MENLHQKVKAIRLLKGLTQEQVGQQLGTTKANYNRMEKGYVEISALRLAQLAELFGMTPAAITAFESAEKQAVSRAEQTVLRLEKELLEVKQTVQDLRKRLDREEENLELERRGKQALRTSMQRYVEQNEDLLTESETFFRYFFQLLVTLFPTDGENAVSLTDINKAWGKLVGYRGGISPEAEQAYLDHRAESPLTSAKLGELDMAAQAMRYLYQTRPKAPLGD